MPSKRIQSMDGGSLDSSMVLILFLLRFKNCKFSKFENTEIFAILIWFEAISRAPRSKTKLKFSIFMSVILLFDRTNHFRFGKYGILLLKSLSYFPSKTRSVYL